MRKFLDPFKRGFFRDDDSLKYPFKQSTIPSVMLYTIGFLVPAGLIILTEWIIVKRIYRHGSPKGTGRSVYFSWCHNVYKVLALFAFGGAMTHLTTNILKYSVGRLRPHFIYVCQPDWSLVNDTSGYIQGDEICMTTDRTLLNEARLSFPSGHASIAMYCGIFLVLYLLKRFTWKRIVFIRPLIQLVAFSAALYTCMTRISDYKHHWHDALGGALLGAVMAFVSIFYINNVFGSVRSAPPQDDGESLTEFYHERGDRKRESDLDTNTSKLSTSRQSSSATGCSKEITPDSSISPMCDFSLNKVIINKVIISGS